MSRSPAAVTREAGVWETHPNPLIRMAGRDRPAQAVLAQALQRATLPIRAVSGRALDQSGRDSHDDAQIDPVLPVDLGSDDVPAPAPGTGYAGLTAAQRGVFHNWLLDPTAPAAPAYRRLYLAHLETRLFEGGEAAAAAGAELQRLLASETWADAEALSRAGLLAGWLAQDGGAIAEVIGHGKLSAASLSVGLGWQALLAAPLSAAGVLAASAVWGLPGGQDAGPAPDLGVIQLNIDSLASTLGVDPLRHALLLLMADQEAAEMGGDEREAVRLLDRWRGPWLPWRCSHRDLHIALPQPNLRPYLAPLVAELRQTARVQPQSPAAVETTAPDTDASAHVDAGAPDWYLVLEFGESRSQFYDYVLYQAQKQPGYRMLMDETRQLVHRIVFRKREMRRFWRLWDYVQNWASTRVYLNGETLEKWKIWPYSQYLR